MGGHATADLVDRAYNSVSVSEAMSAVKNGLYFTFAGVPECLGHRRNGDAHHAAERYDEADTRSYSDRLERPERQGGGFRYDDDAFPAPRLYADPAGFSGSSPREMPPRRERDASGFGNSRAEMVYADNLQGRHIPDFPG